MLSKKECEKALDSLRVFSLQNLNANLKEVTKSNDVIKQLIKEYFELVEKYNRLYDECPQKCEMLKQLQDEVDKYKHEYFAMCDLFENPQPYKFKDLKPYMFVFDKEFNGWGEIVRIIDTFVNEYGEKIVRCFATGSDDIQLRSYKENRFFPVQMANVGCE